MRENKFRLIDTKTAKRIDPKEFFITDGEVFIYYSDFDNSEKADMRHHVILQYTGLKDKNGTEIYEGDVLYVEQIDRIDPYIPHKKNVAVRYEGRDTAFVFDEEVGFVIGLYSTPRELEVIGNIYENPELLERK